MSSRCSCAFAHIRSAAAGAWRRERWALAVMAPLAMLGASIGSNHVLHRDRATTPVLRVCADPNNLPFSNRAGAGYENKIAELLARDLGDSLEYTWWPQRRAWVRNTLNAHKCDVAISVPTGFGPLLTTEPYYRSTYVFVSRADRNYRLTSLDDPRLRHLRIGLHFIGTDYDNPPPAHALGDRGIVRNVVSFSIYGNYAEPNPPSRLIDAVVGNTVDVAIVWGPLAGYFAKKAAVPLAIAPISPPIDARTGTAFTFPIGMGVRKGDVALRDTLQRLLDRDAADVRRILADYGVPLLGNY